MRRFTLFVLSAIVVAQLSGCMVTDRTINKPRPKTEKAPQKATKEKKSGKKTTPPPPPPKTDARTGASRKV